MNNNSVPPILTPGIHVAQALGTAERALQNWQDDPASPRTDVDKMLDIIRDLRHWVHGHVVADVDKPRNLVSEGIEVSRSQV